MSSSKSPPNSGNRAAAIRTVDLGKSYGAASAEVHAVRGVSVEIRRGERVALLGKSGSGKSTLLNILGGLDRPSSGSVEFDGRDLGVMKAVGARDRHIQAIFPVEGVLIGLAGGGLGVLLGWAVSFPADAWMRSMVSREMGIDLQESIFVFPPWLTLGCMAFACVVTTAASVYPARRAARVNPVAALRRE